MGKRTFIILAFLAGCLMPDPLIDVKIIRLGFAQTEVGPDWSTVNRIGLMPFIKGKYGAEMEESLSCTVCLLLNDPKDLEPDSDFILTRDAQKALEKRLGAKVIPLQECMDAYERISRDDLDDSPRTLAQKLGTSLHAEIMIMGNVWKFRDRLGGSRAVSQPASVSFAIYMIKVDGGKLLWKEVFSETQSSLSENALKAKLFFERGSRWLSADELAAFGVNEIFLKFPQGPHPSQPSQDQ